MHFNCRYTTTNLSFSNLKGKDQGVVSLLQACPQLEVYLAQVGRWVGLQGWIRRPTTFRESLCIPCCCTTARCRLWRQHLPDACTGMAWGSEHGLLQLCLLHAGSALQVPSAYLQVKKTAHGEEDRWDGFQATEFSYSTEWVSRDGLLFTPRRWCEACRRVCGGLR
jgi:hypothetical protein